MTDSQPAVDRPLVTVGIVSHGMPMALERLLDSVVSQTYQELEILVCNSSGRQRDVERLLARTCERDKRVRVVQGEQPASRWRDHACLVRQASGRYFLWLHENLLLPPDYVDRCIARFADGQDIDLVGPRCEAFWEGRYFFRGRDYSDTGADSFLRIGDLVRLSYREPDALDHYFFGVFRREALLRALWEGDRFYFGERLALLLRIADNGSIQLATDVTLGILYSRQDDATWRGNRDVNRPRRYRWLGSRLERYLPRSINVCRTVVRSRNLGVRQKIRLLLFCLAHLLIVLAKGQPAWVQRF